MFKIRLPPELQKRFTALAVRTGRSESDLASEAVLLHIEDIEDIHLAKRRLTHRNRRIPLAKLESELNEKC